MIHGEAIVHASPRPAATRCSASSTSAWPRATVDARSSKLLDLPHGIVLVTGPTGSGKTTTLYAALIEDQRRSSARSSRSKTRSSTSSAASTRSRCNTKIGLTFAAGLRAILRHDPDVVLVGEIRDQETAEIAIQASLTGHLVFSTLHTNDAPGAATRLIDMGVEPYLVASSVEVVMAQRLVRVICPQVQAARCREARRRSCRDEFGDLVPPVLYQGRRLPQLPGHRLSAAGRASSR